MYTSMELSEIMAEREDAMDGDMSILARIQRAMPEIEEDELIQFIDTVCMVSSLKSRGNMDKASAMSFMAGIELGRELERRNGI